MAGAAECIEIRSLMGPAQNLNRESANIHDRGRVIPDSIFSQSLADDEGGAMTGFFPNYQ